MCLDLDFTWEKNGENHSLNTERSWGLKYYQAGRGRGGYEQRGGHYFLILQNTQSLPILRNVLLNF